MFFFRYLAHELRARALQTSMIALGLALGVGLVITVTAASDGVGAAQSSVLKGLYGVGTDLTVTKAPPPFNPNNPGGGGTKVTMGSGGAQVCNDGHCSSGAQNIDNLRSQANAPIPLSAVSSIAGLSDVKSAIGGLNLNESQLSIPANLGQGGAAPSSKSFTVTGVDLAHLGVGPLSNATLASGRTLTGADTDANDAVVDSAYASSNGITAGSTITIAKTSFTVVGLVSQPQASTPPNVYIPLARAQALGTATDSAGNSAALTGEVNTIYVTAASSADIPTVQNEIARLLPGDQITTPSSLASQVSESLSSTASLAGDLGTWLSVLVLLAAFGIAALLTTTAVTRRVRELGTLRALGWRSRRVIGQVMGESALTGLLGAAIGIALGFAGAAVIDAIAPSMSAALTVPTGQHTMTMGPNGPQVSDPTVTHSVAVPLQAAVSIGSLGLAALLALLGGLLAGAVGCWRVNRLRPSDALAKVA